MFARVCTRSKFTRSVVKLVEHTRTHGWVVHESSNEEWRLRTCFAGIPRAASTSFCHRPRLDCKLGLHRSCPHTAMSGLRITNEITNLDGPGPPVVQTDFEPQGDTEIEARFCLGNRVSLNSLSNRGPYRGRVPLFYGPLRPIGATAARQIPVLKVTRSNRVSVTGLPGRGDVRRYTTQE